MPKRELILFFIDQHGWVDDFPIIEFFGGEQIVEDLVAAGHIATSPLDNGWTKYELTDAGRKLIHGLIHGYDPHAAGDTPSVDRAEPDARSDRGGG